MKEVYKRQCCGFRILENLPIKTEEDIIGKWEKKTSWRHVEHERYTLDCLNSFQNQDNFLARVLDSGTILMELLVSNCDKVREVVKMHGIGHNHGNNQDYHNISVNNVKHPRVDPSKLRDNVIEDNSSSHEAFGAKKKETRVHYKCIYFKIYETNDDEDKCDKEIEFVPTDWAE